MSKPSECVHYYNFLKEYLYSEIGGNYFYILISTLKEDLHREIEANHYYTSVCIQTKSSQ